MDNHWHFVVRPTKPEQMSRFFRWLTLAPIAGHYAGRIGTRPVRAHIRGHANVHGEAGEA